MTAGPDRTAGASGGALEPARVATVPAPPGVAVLARLARPVAGVGGLLLVEILTNPRARAAVGALARSLGRRLAPETVVARPPAADRSAITCQVTVMEEPGTLSVLVRCVETALAVPASGEPPTAAPRRSPATVSPFSSAICAGGGSTRLVRGSTTEARSPAT